MQCSFSGPFPGNVLTIHVSTSTKNIFKTKNVKYVGMKAEKVWRQDLYLYHTIVKYTLHKVGVCVN